jgi:hypothetical protein
LNFSLAPICFVRQNSLGQAVFIVRRKRRGSIFSGIFVREIFRTGEFLPEGATKMDLKLPGSRVARWSALSLGAVLVLAACVAPSTEMHPPQHIVLLWLKHPLHAADRAEIARRAQLLQFMPGVARIEIGRSVPLPPELREGGFDLAVAITFEDRFARQRYEKNMRGELGEARYLQPFVRRVAAYDFGLR